MKDSKLRFEEELLNEISDLKKRSSSVGYKNIIPQLPQSKSDQSMAGFMYRLYNWKRQLEIMENPGGFPSRKKSIIINENSSELFSPNQLINGTFSDFSDISN